MSVARKAAVSLLLSLVLFIGFTYLSYSGLFGLVQTRFYKPHVELEIRRNLEKNTVITESFLEEMIRTFESLLAQDEVRASFTLNQDANDIRIRGRYISNLFDNIQGLQWVRFVDSGGLRVHFSTRQSDISIVNDNQIIYKNYSDVDDNIVLSEAILSGQARYNIIGDDTEERVIFCLPLYDTLDIYRGIAIFPVGVRAIFERLVEQGGAAASDEISVIRTPPAIVLGLRSNTHSNIKEVVSPILSASSNRFSALRSELSQAPLYLTSMLTIQNFYVSTLVNSDVFNIPDSMKILICTAFFFILFTIVFLLSNIKQDPLVVVANRMKNLQTNLLLEYMDKKTEVDLSIWKLGLEQRREEIKQEMKRGLKVREGNRLDISLNAFVDKTYDDLLIAIGADEVSADNDPGRGRIELTKNDGSNDINIDDFERTSASKSSIEDGSVNSFEEELDELGEDGIEEVPETLNRLSEKKNDLLKNIKEDDLEELDEPDEYDFTLAGLSNEAEPVNIYNQFKNVQANDRLDKAAQAMYTPSAPVYKGKAAAVAIPVEETDNERDLREKLERIRTNPAEFDPFAPENSELNVTFGGGVSKKAGSTLYVDEIAEWDPLAGNDLGFSEAAKQKLDDLSLDQGVLEEIDQNDEIFYAKYNNQSTRPSKSTLAVLSNTIAGNSTFFANSPFVRTSSDIGILQSENKRSEFEDTEIIKQKNGINFIDQNVASNVDDTDVDIDKKLKKLIDSILRGID